MSKIKDPQLESSEGATADPSQGEPEPTSQGEPQGTPDPKTQEGTPQWYKSQLDKNQNALDDKLTERENVWAEEKQHLESQLQGILQDVSNLKKSPDEVFTPPKTFDPEDPTDEIRFMREQRVYDNKVAAKEKADTKNEIKTLRELFEQDQETKEKARDLDIVKSTSKGIWMQQNNMSIEKAEECWNWQSTVKADDRIKIIGKMFLNKDGGNELADELKRREDMKLDGAVPGAGAGGGAGETIDAKEYTKTADHSNMYETK